ncbi:hypothetical protein B566_EDAN017602 [Ephemera danica]|nr:hypothetical protein B566_EDAN017602 [Ephemera danica]
MAEEDTEYLKLPLEDRCVHKLWKARVHGYEEATKLFRQIPDEKSPEWNKFLGMVKKFAADSNAAAQEKGLEAVLAYVESAGPAGKTVGEVMSGIVTKCLAAPKAKTKDLSIQVTLMYVEIEKHDAVMDELIKGFDQKNPKVVAACVNVATQALREYGNKVINVKPLLTELEAEFEKLSGERAIPNRYLRSQQQRQQQVEEAAGEGDDDGGGDDEEDGPAPVDPFELLDPVDILSKLPKDFYEKLEAKKWQERKEALDELEKLLQHPKLEAGDYGDLIRALKKIITKDTNVMIVAMAGKGIASLANGLKKKFQPYALSCASCILEKFREKKTNVVAAMREAIDAVTQIVSLEQMQEDVLEALNNKNPSVKAETAAFLSRYFTKCTPQMLDRKMLKAYTPALIKTLNESDPTVRDNSAEALGTAMKVVTEKAIMAYISDVEKLKLEKIKECCEKAVITAKIPKAPRPATAPAKMAAASKPTANKPVPVKRPGASAPAKKPVAKKAAPAAAGKGKAPAKKAAAAPSTAERELTDEEVDETASELFAPDVLAGLVDGNWKVRLSAAEQLLQVVNGMEKLEIPAQVLIRTLNKKPGLRDGNFQVLKAKFDVVKAVAENAKFTRTTAQFCLQDVADKLGDPKTGAAAADALTSIAEATKLDFVATEVVTFAFSQKSPRLQQESMLWLSNAIREFGFV